MSADIDIDVPNRDAVLALIQHTAARQSNGKKHNSGIYVTDIPRDPVLGCAALDYETAETRGYFKIDLLNMSVYSLIQDPAHYELMLAATPPWDRLWKDPVWVKQLVHIGNYTELLKSMRPDSITRMAAFISVIRPGKAHLQNQSWSRVFESVWDGDDSRGYTFKKAHSVGYAALVVLNMNLLHTPDQSN
jgi:hypothetical protein